MMEHSSGTKKRKEWQLVFNVLFYKKSYLLMYEFFPSDLWPLMVTILFSFLFIFLLI